MTKFEAGPNSPESHEDLINKANSLEELAEIIKNNQITFEYFHNHLSTENLLEIIKKVQSKDKKSNEEALKLAREAPDDYFCEILGKLSGKMLDDKNDIVPYSGPVNIIPLDNERPDNIALANNERNTKVIETINQFNGEYVSNLQSILDANKIDYQEERKVFLGKITVHDIEQYIDSGDAGQLDQKSLALFNKLAGLHATIIEIVEELKDNQLSPEYVEHITQTINELNGTPEQETNNAVGTSATEINGKVGSGEISPEEKLKIFDELFVGPSEEKANTPTDTKIEHENKYVNEIFSYIDNYFPNGVSLTRYMELVYNPKKLQGLVYEIVDTLISKSKLNKGPVDNENVVAVIDYFKKNIISDDDAVLLEGVEANNSKTWKEGQNQRVRARINEINQELKKLIIKVAESSTTASGADIVQEVALETVPAVTESGSEAVETVVNSETPEKDNGKIKERIFDNSIFSNTSVPGFISDSEKIWVINEAGSLNNKKGKFVKKLSDWKEKINTLVINNSKSGIVTIDTENVFAKFQSAVEILCSAFSTDIVAQQPNIDSLNVAIKNVRLAYNELKALYPKESVVTGNTEGKQAATDTVPPIETALPANETIPPIDNKSELPISNELKSCFAEVDSVQDKLNGAIEGIMNLIENKNQKDATKKLEALEKNIKLNKLDSGIAKLGKVLNNNEKKLIEQLKSTREQIKNIITDLRTVLNELKKKTGNQKIDYEIVERLYDFQRNGFKEIVNDNGVVGETENGSNNTVVPIETAEQNLLYPNGTKAEYVKLLEIENVFVNTFNIKSIYDLFGNSDDYFEFTNLLPSEKIIILNTFARELRHAVKAAGLQKFQEQKTAADKTINESNHNKVTKFFIKLIKNIPTNFTEEKTRFEYEKEFIKNVDGKSIGDKISILVKTLKTLEAQTVGDKKLVEAYLNYLSSNTIIHDNNALQTIESLKSDSEKSWYKLAVSRLTTSFSSKGTSATIGAIAAGTIGLTAMPMMLAVAGIAGGVAGGINYTKRRREEVLSRRGGKGEYVTGQSLADVADQAILIDYKTLKTLITKETPVSELETIMKSNLIVWSDNFALEEKNDFIKTLIELKVSETIDDKKTNKDSLLKPVTTWMTRIGIKGDAKMALSIAIGATAGIAIGGLSSYVKSLFSEPGVSTPVQQPPNNALTQSASQSNTGIETPAPETPKPVELSSGQITLVENYKMDPETIKQFTENPDGTFTKVGAPGVFKIDDEGRFVYSEKVGGKTTIKTIEMGQDYENTAWKEVASTEKATKSASKTNITTKPVETKNVSESKTATKPEQVAGEKKPDSGGNKKIISETETLKKATAFKANNITADQALNENYQTNEVATKLPPKSVSLEELQKEIDNSAAALQKQETEDLNKLFRSPTETPVEQPAPTRGFNAQEVLNEASNKPNVEDPFKIVRSGDQIQSITRPNHPGEYILADDNKTLVYQHITGGKATFDLNSGKDIYNDASWEHSYPTDKDFKNLNLGVFDNKPEIAPTTETLPNSTVPTEPTVKPIVPSSPIKTAGELYTKDNANVAEQVNSVFGENASISTQKNGLLSIKIKSTEGLNPKVNELLKMTNNNKEGDLVKELLLWKKLQGSNTNESLLFNQLTNDIKSSSILNNQPQLLEQLQAQTTTYEEAMDIIKNIITNNQATSKLEILNQVKEPTLFNKQAKNFLVEYFPGSDNKINTTISEGVSNITYKDKGEIFFENNKTYFTPYTKNHDLLELSSEKKIELVYSKTIDEQINSITK
jgi:hypothetical protein